MNDLDESRQILARAFQARNPQLDGDSLTEITQRVIDRLVFTRFLEDKLIEPRYLVANFGESGDVWEDFVSASRRLDSIYNGVVFKKHALIDSPDFSVDEARFSDICERLSHLNSPYDFNTIPIHILGSIYERFLGNVIVADRRGVRIEPKSEVRKARGVYYTPEYIVRKVVQETVGSLIVGKAPTEIAGMRFADIACGSGSFLLGVYDLLLRHHSRYYNENPKRARKGDCVERDGILYLSLQKKREILLNNIYGVDIDPQAVEVTQLSLYLKLLEEETIASARGYQMQWHLALLPPLNKNIVCGNSLVGPDVLEGNLFARDEEKRLNPMDFQNTFSEVMKRGGFDAVVGNPPYVRIQSLSPAEIDYLTEHYRSANGNADLYVSFIERAYRLLRSKGRLGQIVPNKFFTTDYGEGLRSLISKEHALAKLIDFGANQVFEATTYTCLLFLEKHQNAKSFQYAESQARATALEHLRFVDTALDALGKEPWSFADQATAKLLRHLTVDSFPLLDLPEQMNRGSSTGADDVFVFKKGTLDVEPTLLEYPYSHQILGGIRSQQGEPGEFSIRIIAMTRLRAYTPKQC